MKMSYGGVVINRDGQVLLREPTGHYGGYVWTHAKGQPEPGETPEETALREVKQETGIEARIVKRLAGTFKGTTGLTMFFLMAVAQDTGQFDPEETQTVVWVEPQEAAKLIMLTPDPIGRERDLNALREAYAAFRQGLS
jgi:8-oxo-dGTP diphosphatase